MTTSTAPQLVPTPPSSTVRNLRRLYLTRFAFAVVWAALLLVAADRPGAVATVLLVLYPLVDAASVLVQLRTAPDGSASRAPEWVNLTLSTLAAVALGVTSATSIDAAILTFGLWAVASGLLQLVTAALRRRSGGQVPLIVSGAISVVAGIAFSAQGAAGGPGVTGLSGYAAFGGLFFLVAAVRLGVLARRSA